MKNASLVIFLLITSKVQSQVWYDSISISKFLITDDLPGVKWKDTLKAGHYPNYLSNEKTVWIKPAKVSKVLPSVISLTNRIKANGTEDVSKCFIPRHSINFYKNGRISRYLLVCFECDGVRFSDDPLKTFIKNLATRDKQMGELKTLFKDIL